ncbi:DnaB-like helicase C-terminal domain-containing protein [Sphingomonas naphthae]|uniref:DNA 5'-3' helicase n=1 Tax=Sphingomonas naphthae TaxID=1813468 RepID=A0ABY7TP69_9SPHN|nr:DnaB-like helicase C-terminal domain-containing protein [Sphingomonas naphthae]WCT75020.1 DnaB-like helicase C-terminal domain-containing protein [Sphingomonas naphthae]
MSDIAFQEIELSDLSIGSPRAELALLGELLGDNSGIDMTADRLMPEDFSVPLYGRVFAVIVREASLGRSVNAITLSPYFRDDRDFEELDAQRRLSDAARDSIGDYRPTPYLDQILSLSKRRRIVAGLSRIQAEARNLEMSVDDILSEADATLSTIVDRAEGTHEVTGADALGEVIAEFGLPVVGVRCGTIGQIDDLAGPLRPGQMVIVAGRPGMAKTATAVSYAIGAARAGHGTLFVSLEMSAKELGARIGSDLCFDVAQGTGVPFEVIRDRRPSVSQTLRIREARVSFSDMPLQIVDRGGCKMATLETMIRRHKRKMAAAGRKLELVIVDYLQLLSPDQPMRSSYEAVSEISKRIKQAAKSQGVAIMALAQLSRSVEQRPDRRPQLSDLRDSGQIEQDADTVIFLYREAYYTKKEEPKRGTSEWYDWSVKYAEIERHIEFICAKRRDGAEGRGAGLFFGEFMAVRGGDYYETRGESL